MLLLNFILPAVAIASTTNKNASPSSASVKIIHEFPKGTWIENIALRPSGSVLAADLTTPNIYEVPLDGTSDPKLLHTFANATGVSGIAAASDGSYLLVTGKLSLTNFSAFPGTYAIHRLRFDECTDAAEVSFTGAIPSVIQPNGIVSIPNTPYLVIADSVAGKAYRYDTEAHTLTVYLDHQLLKPSGTSLKQGVNGVKFSLGYFYFSNTNQEIVGRIRVSGLDYSPEGEPEVVGSQTSVDDFIVDDRTGDVYVAENGLNELGFIDTQAKSTIPSVLAGSPNSTQLAGPTSAQWVRGQEGKRLIMATTGGLLGYLNGSHTVGGTISLIDLDG